MTNPSPLHAAIRSLPQATRAVLPELGRGCADALADPAIARVQHLYITGCGDSHHAGVAAAMAFRQFAGLHSVTPLPAMGFARYQASFLPPPDVASSLVIGISVSGQVSRTAEALELARLAGATTLAITANLDGPLAGVADLILQPPAPPPVPEARDMILPGSSSYIISLLALYQLALQMGLQNGRLTTSSWQEQQFALLRLADHMEETIIRNDSLAAGRVAAWSEASHFVYCGSGPNYGTALFSAAKLLEASGDIAVAQDIEEWAHLEYFGRQREAPTILISNAGGDLSRALEVAKAARAIGRLLAIVAPDGSALANAVEEHGRLAFTSHAPECYSPLLACIPGLLIAAHRAQLLDEPYFRAFGGGRSRQGGGGISRIRDSRRIHQLQA